jgi:hypothetical protein
VAADFLQAMQRRLAAAAAVSAEATEVAAAGGFGTAVEARLAVLCLQHLPHQRC